MVAGLKGGVGDSVGLGVFRGELDRGGAELDTGYFFEGGCGSESEQAAAAIRIDEEARAGAGGLFADVAGEGGQNERVVLEEIAGEEVKAERLRSSELRVES